MMRGKGGPEADSQQKGHLKTHKGGEKHSSSNGANDRTFAQSERLSWMLNRSRAVREPYRVGTGTPDGG